jgi:predicted AlkP superfamily pyrophosphatase or phosphodiesterase
VLVLDGLGVEQLEQYRKRHAAPGFFKTVPFRTISTVCPATTAAAVTTFATGASPSEHGVLGWYLNLHDLGLVSTILMTTTRTGMPILAPDFNFGAYMQIPSHLRTVRTKRELLTWGRIAESRYSSATGAWDRSASYTTLLGMQRQILKTCRRRGRRMVYAYWPGYDSHCHEHGCEAEETVAHLQELDAFLEALIRGLSGTHTTLLVLADHGLVDAPPRRRVHFNAVPGLLDCLPTLPSGDARQAAFFVRPAKVKTFLSIVEKHLSRAAVCVPGEYMIENGFYGPGALHPALRQRVGDYVLLARENYAFTTTLPGEDPEFNVGNHGGLSPREVQVPLFTVHC